MLLGAQQHGTSEKLAGGRPAALVLPTPWALVPRELRLGSTITLSPPGWDPSSSFCPRGPGLSEQMENEPGDLGETLYPLPTPGTGSNFPGLAEPLPRTLPLLVRKGGLAFSPCSAQQPLSDTLLPFQRRLRKVNSQFKVT